MKSLLLTLVIGGFCVTPLLAQTNNAPAPTPAPPAPAPATTPDSATPQSGPRPDTYTVISGDSLWKIAQQFDTSVKKLKKLNNLKNNNLKPGQVLKLPPAPTPTPTPKAAASTPVATPSLVSATEGSGVGATITGSNENAADSSPSPTPSVSTTLPQAKRKKLPTTDDSIATNPTLLGDYYHPPKTPAAVTPPPPPSTYGYTPATPTTTAASAIGTNPASPTFKHLSSTQIAPTPVSPLTAHSKGFFGFMSHDDSSQQSDWAVRFQQRAEELAAHHISYGQSWRPPGESHSWVMDCSNTSRYLYKVTTNLDLPRTASDQYYYLHLQNRAWDVPMTAKDEPDTVYLGKHLKPGDLLFWENTYRPERQPPITHVMIFLGQDPSGRWLMAGSQSGHDGEHHHTGPDIYQFDPTAPSGGYTTWLGMVHHKGRFVAFGRPLAADPTKLASN